MHSSYTNSYLKFWCQITAVWIHPIRHKAFFSNDNVSIELSSLEVLEEQVTPSGYNSTAPFLGMFLWHEW